MSRLYANVSIIECTDADGLQQILSGGLERYVVRQLSETAVVVDHERLDEVLKLLRRQGQTPRVTSD